MNTFTEQLAATRANLKRLAQELSAIFPEGNSVELYIRRYTDPPDVQVAIHGVKSYEEGTAIFRRLEIQRRNKSVWNDYQARTVLQADIGPGISLSVYCSGLPPSCRIEKTVEKVPKQQTIDTGEFIEIERTKIVCGHEADQPQPLFAEGATAA